VRGEFQGDEGTGHRGGSDVGKVIDEAARFNFRLARQPLGMFKAVLHAFPYTEQVPVRWVR
jgi:hypothetical protein